MVKIFAFLATIGTLAAAPLHAQTASIGASTVETIVMVRHGEKPEAGLGQLDCQGLNRALALPAVIAAKFGRPSAIFAPDPGETKSDGGTQYNYVRPLATIEPTAIGLHMPVDTSLGVSNIDGLRQRLEAPAFAASLLLVAWEHTDIIHLARDLLYHNGGNPDAVPDWKGRDFDGIFIVRITRTAGAAKASFERQTEGLEAQPTSCPTR